jgi:hypothetical protein
VERQTVGRIGRWSLGWRIAVALVGIALLVNGSARMSDHVWPFGPMSQYAFAPPEDDTIVITRVEGLRADGVREDLPLRSGVSGISRAEIEDHASDIVKDPALLRQVAEGWTTRHPDQPALRQVWLVQDRTTLVRGRTTSTSLVELANWTVPR